MWKNLIYLVLAIDRCEPDAHADSSVCLLSLSSHVERGAEVDLGATETGGQSTNAAAISADVTQHPEVETEAVGLHLAPVSAPAESNSNSTPSMNSTEPEAVPATETAEAAHAESAAPTPVAEVAPSSTTPVDDETRHTPWARTPKGVPPPHEQAFKAKAKVNGPGEAPLSLKPEGFVGFPKDNPKSLVKNALADRFAMAKQLGTSVSSGHLPTDGSSTQVDNVLSTMYKLGTLIKAMPHDTMRLHTSRTEKPTPSPYAHAREFHPFGIWSKADKEIPVA